MRHVIAWTQLVPSVPGRWPLVWIRDPSTGNGFPATNTLADVGMAPDRRARATYAADTVRISLEERCSGMKVDGRTDRHMHSARTSSDTERPFAAEVVVGDAVGDDNARLTAQSTGTDDLMYGDVVTEEALLVVSSHCKITDGLV
jgi:hypothetical protein